VEQLLAIRGLVKRYGSFTAVDGIDLDVRGGEILALLGPNGAGKTTTIRVIMGQLHPTAGSALVAGIDCWDERARAMRLVGYLPDEPAFHDHLTGREVVRFVGRLHGMPSDEIAARGQPLAERIGIADALDEYAVNYSLGMRKRLGLVLALLHRPQLLVLDEPTAGLDPYGARTLHELLREFARDGGAVLHSTHLLEQAERLCDRVAIISRGRVAACGTLAAMRERAAADATLEQLFFAATGDAPA
jgi:ABC-2 type transport system ATP-binding protein